MSSNDDSPILLDDEKEPSTWVRIQPGTVIGVNRASFPSMVAIDIDATPIVNVPSIPMRISSLRPPAWDATPSQTTTLRFINAGVDVAAGSLRAINRSPWLARVTRAAIVCAGALALSAAVDRMRAREQPASVSAMHTEPVMDVVFASTALMAPTAEPARPVVTHEAAAPQVAPPRVESLAGAHDALAHHHLAEARAGYEAVLAQDPMNVEAIAGLADVARELGDRARAETLYDRALRASPHYVPARVGIADLLWDAGDRARSIAEYRRIAESAPRVPPHVLERLANNGAGSAF